MRLIRSGPILGATVVVPDLAAASAIYRDALGYRVVDGGRVPAVLAASWGDPQIAGAAYELLGPGTSALGVVRLVERAGAASAAPLACCGWRAIEISVADIRALRRTLEGSGFRVVGEPAPLPNNASIHAMQVVGPGGEMLYLTEVSEQSDFVLPPATHPVDRVFIVVLSVPDFDEATAFYAEHLRVDWRLDTEMPLTAAAAELDLDAERRHRVGAGQLAGATVIEIDRHPAELDHLRHDPSRLPDATALVTVTVPALEPFAGRMLTEPRIAPGPLYGGGRTATVIGPAGERLELVEPAA